MDKNLRCVQRWRHIHGVVPSCHPPIRQDGHTLIELMVAMVVALVAMGAIYSVYHVQQRQHYSQQRIVKARQNARSALAILEQQVRMAGYDPEGSGLFGITDVRRYDLIGTRPNPQGQPALTFTRDVDENGNFDGGGEQIRFCIRQEKDTGKTYLAWNMGSGRFPMAENIDGLGFAYAVDRDGDGQADKCGESEYFVWAVDSDNDNKLDTNLDVNCDGRVNEQDDHDGDGRITPADGAGLNPPVNPDRIKAIHVWMSIVSGRRVGRSGLRKNLILGDTVVKPSPDGFRRNILETTISCRNL